jgi:hypothetical protein
MALEEGRICPTAVCQVIREDAYGSRRVASRGRNGSPRNHAQDSEPLQQQQDTVRRSDTGDLYRRAGVRRLGVRIAQSLTPHFL